MCFVYVSFAAVHSESILTCEEWRSLFHLLLVYEPIQYFTPYAEIDDDILTEVTQWQLYFAFFAALMIRVNAAPDRRREEQIFSALLIMSSCVAFVFVGLHYLLVFMKLRKRAAIYVMEIAEKTENKRPGLAEKDNKEGEDNVRREEGGEDSRCAGGREVVNTDKVGRVPGDEGDPGIPQKSSGNATSPRRSIVVLPPLQEDGSLGQAPMFDEGNAQTSVLHDANEPDLEG